jgi:hypothetical protein
VRKLIFYIYEQQNLMLNLTIYVVTYCTGRRANFAEYKVGRHILQYLQQGYYRRMDHIQEGGYVWNGLVSLYDNESCALSIAAHNYRVEIRCESSIAAVILAGDIYAKNVADAVEYFPRVIYTGEHLLSDGTVCRHYSCASV